MLLVETVVGPCAHTPVGIRSRQLCVIFDCPEKGVRKAIHARKGAIDDDHAVRPRPGSTVPEAADALPAGNEWRHRQD